MTDTKKAIELQVGTSYWIGFKHEKTGRTLRIAATVVNVEGRLMAEAYDGHLFELPKQITEAHPMREFQRLRWLSNCHKRAGNTDEAEELMKAAYHVMEDGFYTARIEHLTRRWDGHSNDVLQGLVDELHHFRPDLPIDDLTFVREQKALLASMHEFIEELDAAHHARTFAGKLKRFANGVAKALGLCE